MQGGEGGGDVLRLRARLELNRETFARLALYSHRSGRASTRPPSPGRRQSRTPRSKVYDVPSRSAAAGGGLGCVCGLAHHG